MFLTDKMVKNRSLSALSFQFLFIVSKMISPPSRDHIANNKQAQKLGKQASTGGRWVVDALGWIVLVASGEIEAVKSRGQSRAKLVVGEWGTDVRREGCWGWEARAPGRCDGRSED